VVHVDRNNRIIDIGCDPAAQVPGAIHQQFGRLATSVPEPVPVPVPQSS
jgi:hypothetical protein